ncbi:MAG: LysR family transcriptional regulator [Rhizobiales bacterium PAR1]|nr:MAG: LysR family transcriptional regulator [Rhizobiales bacterium PAR1]
MRYLPEIEAIRSFSVVAEELNFRRAADRLGIDHSALSRRIRDLEHRLGFAVFARSTREVRLTEAGKVFLEENTNLLRGLHRSVDQARMVAEGRSGLIRIGYMSFAAAHLLPSLIARFQAIRPTVRFQLTYMKSHAQKEALSRGDIDVGLMIGPWETETFETTRLSVDSLCVFFGNAWPLATKPDLSVADLVDQPQIMGSLEQWDLYRWILDDVFLRSGIVPNVVLEASSITGILGLVQAGLGITVFPKTIAALAPPSIGHRQLRDVDLVVETIGVSARNPSALVRAFMATAREFYENPGS